MSTQGNTLQQTIRELRPSLLGRFFYHCIRLRRKVTLSNIRRAFGSEISDKDIEHLAVAFYTHLSRGFFENIAVSWMNQEKIKSKIRIEGMEHLYEAAEGNKGILLLTGHFGNWELAPVAGILHFQEFKGRLHVLRRQLVNKQIEKILFRRFYEVGLDVIPKKSTLNKVMDSLSKNDTVAFIMDQYARPGKEGIIADFFGHPAGTFRSLAMVARSSGAPVIPAFSWRESRGKHVMKFDKPIQWKSHEDPDKEILINTQEYNHRIEEFIRSHPDQWLWIHKRWKVKPTYVKKRKR